MRYNDVRDGTNVVGDVLEKYKKAWELKQMVASNGLYVDWWYVNQDRPEIPKQVGFTAGYVVPYLVKWQGVNTSAAQMLL